MLAAGNERTGRRNQDYDKATGINLKFKESPSFSPTAASFSSKRRFDVNHRDMRVRPKFPANLEIKKRHKNALSPVQRNAPKLSPRPGPPFAFNRPLRDGVSRSVVNLLVAKGACLLFYFKNLGHSGLSGTAIYGGGVHTAGQAIVLFYI